MKTCCIARPYAAFILVGAPLLTAIFGWIFIQKQDPLTSVICGYNHRHKAAVVSSAILQCESPNCSAL